MAHDGQEPRNGSGDGGERPETGDETRPVQPSDKGDETLPLRPSDQTMPLPGTAPSSGPGSSPPGVPGPGVPGPGTPGPASARPTPWSGRAGVPPAGPAAADTTRWDAGAEQPADRWWLPIVIGLIALVLLGLVAVGAWLFMSDGPPEPGVPSPSPSATIEPTPTPEPTTAPPTTEPPTVAPSSPAATVPMPQVVGLPLADAREVLDQLGIAYRLTFRESGEPAGTVIETDPPAGEQVDPADQVTLVISEALATRPTTPAPATSTAAPPGG